MKPLVDVAAAFADLLSQVLAMKITILLILFVFTLVRHPKDVEIEFPAPSGTKYELADKVKRVKIPQYPKWIDITFLILIYLLDIALLYPYTLKNGEWTNHLLLLLLSVVVFPVQVGAAHGWSCMSPSWIAAQRRHALWHNKAWKIYYMSFILTGLAIGLLIIGKGVAFFIFEVLGMLPGIWRAQSHAFSPLKNLEGPIRAGMRLLMRAAIVILGVFWRYLTFSPLRWVVGLVRRRRYLADASEF